MKSIFLLMAFFMFNHHILGSVPSLFSLLNQDNDVKIAVIDGVRVVSNPGKPQYGKSKLNLNDEVRIGETETGDAFVYRPHIIQSDAEGNIYILDWGLNCIKVFDSQGEFLRKFGSKGQGPGEFTMISYFCLTPDEKIHLLDCNQRRLSIFSITGEHLEVIRYESDKFLTELKYDGNKRLYVAEDERNIDWDTLNEKDSFFPITKHIIYFDVESNTWHHFADFKGEIQRMRRMPSGGYAGGRGLFRNTWNVDSRGNVVIGLNQTYQLSVLAPDGNILFRFGRKARSKKNPRYNNARRIGIIISKFLPVFSEKILFDEEDRIWVELYPDEETDRRVYDIFSKEGIYLKQVIAPYPIMQFNNSRIYGRAHNADGNLVVKSARLVLDID